jgi:hypothetical protein
MSGDLDAWLSSRSFANMFTLGARRPVFMMI